MVISRYTDYKMQDFPESNVKTRCYSEDSSALSCFRLRARSSYDDDGDNNTGSRAIATYETTRLTVNTSTASLSANLIKRCPSSKIFFFFPAESIADRSPFTWHITR
jgi:hypothetical protein